MIGFINLSGVIDGVLDAFPDEVEAALKGGFYLSNRGVNCVIDRVEELGNLVNAEKCVSIENERDNNLARSERAPLEGCVPSVGEGIAAGATPDAGTVVPGLDGGLATLWTGGLFPRLLTAPLDFIIERLWTQHYF